MMIIKHIITSDTFLYYFAANLGKFLKTACLDIGKFLNVIKNNKIDYFSALQIIS